MESIRTRFHRVALIWILGATLVTVPATPAASASRDTSAVFLGSFYSERFTEEHEYRDQIDLWREGQHVFGLTWDIAGLIGDQVPTVGRFEGTLTAGTSVLILSNRFRGAFNDSVLTGAYDYEPDDSLRLQRSSDRMETNPSRAPLGGYEAWRAWADSVIDASEARSPYLRQEVKKCEGGDGWACVGIGNRLRDRKREEARRYWERACELDAWPGCRFLGDQKRYQAVLRKLCSSNVKPSLHRNMACEELGAMAEKAGKLEDAVEWYRLGCSGYPLPRTSCTRLEALEKAKAARGN